MEQPSTTTARKLCKRVWAFLIITACLGLVLFLFWPYFLQTRQTPRPSTPNAGGVVKTLTHHSPFSLLRTTRFFENQFAVLRHTPTSQRIILLTGRKNDPAIYNALFDQPLTPLEFSLLLHTFKGHTKFQNSQIQVTAVRLNKEGLLQQGTYRLLYHYYIVETRIDNQAHPFDAYVGKIVNAKNEPKGLLMTFNSQNDALLEPLSDLLKLYEAQHL